MISRGQASVEDSRHDGMSSPGPERGGTPQLTWRDLFRHGRFAAQRAWAISPSLLGGLAFIEILAAFLPVLSAIAAGLVVREAKYIFDGEPGHQGPLAIVLALMAGLILADAFAATARRYVTSRLTDQLRLQLSTDILGHISSLDLAFFEDPDSQDVAERAALRPGRDFVQFLVTSISILTQGFQVVSLGVVLLYIEPVFTPVVVLVSLPLLAFRWRMAKLTYETERKQATVRRWSGYYFRALSTNTFLPTVRLYNLAPVLIEKFASYLGRITSENRRLYGKQALGEAAASVGVTVAGLGLVLWVGYRAVSGQMSIQMLGTFVIALGRMQACIQTLVDSIAKSLEKVLFISNLAELLETEPSIRHGALRPEKISGDIELRDVRFTYPGSTNRVIDGVDMRLEAGKTVALVGPNGCGKTTLTRLIARLHDVDSGAILLDGHDLRDYSLTHLHEQIAYVSQSAVYFEATARENIAYGDWQRLSEVPGEVQRIAEAAQVGDMIDRLPDGYETLLGRRFGTFDLSGGQWQKLAFARALAKNASILILDEPTASMDIQSEVDMYAAFEKLAAGRTTLLISHRFSTVAMAHHIYVMDEGRIVEHGTHDELLRRGGMYAAMYDLHRRVALRSDSAERT